jgi:hypothetical protein
LFDSPAVPRYSYPVGTPKNRPISLDNRPLLGRAALREELP